jgi:hypothetical protein
MPHRRFPPPWTVEELNAACFVVRDSNGQQLAYVYFEDEPGRQSAGEAIERSVIYLNGRGRFLLRHDGWR